MFTWLGKSLLGRAAMPLRLEIGPITEMAQAGVDVRNIHLVIGASAGARVAVQLINAPRLTPIGKK